MQGKDTGTPQGIFFNIWGCDFTIYPDGSMSLYLPGRRDIEINPHQAYALYVFFTKLPHVGALLDRLEAERQEAFFVSMAEESDLLQAHKTALTTDGDHKEKQ